MSSSPSTVLLAIVACLCCRAVAIYAVFSVPQVRIQAFKSGGFRASIPHVDGLHLFGFHGNLNKPLKNFEAGEYKGEVRYAKNGRWSFEVKDVVVRPGDKIYYWVFVLYQRLGYRREDQEFTIAELVDENHNEVTWSNPDYPIITGGESVPHEPPRLPLEPPPPSTTRAPPPPPSEEDIDLMTCQRTIIKLTPKLFKLEEELDVERDRTKILISILDKIPGGKRLKMKGRFSQTDEPIEVVNFVLSQKLKLKPLVENATRNEDMSISFELAYVEDLVNVLQEAKNRLSPTSSVSISV